MKEMQFSEFLGACYCSRHDMLSSCVVSTTVHSTVCSVECTDKLCCQLGDCDGGFVCLNLC